MSTHTKRLITAALALDLILVLFVTDQLTKWVMLEHVLSGPLHQAMGFWPWISALELPRAPFTQESVTGFLNWVMVWNEGISFGLLSGQGANHILLVALSTIVIGFSFWMLRTPHLWVRLTLAVIIGGALGNLWDRVRFGAVADFVDLHAFGWHYPAFNLADSCIVLGVVSLLLFEMRKK